MASVNSDLNDLHRGVKSALSARWRLLMFEGVALIVLGVLAMRLIPLTQVHLHVVVGASPAI